jgi:cell division protein FtsW
MVASASVPKAMEMGDALYFFKRQLAFALIGLTLAGVAYGVPLRIWEQVSYVVTAVAGLLLVLVLIPGLGHEVNGSRRWLRLGFTLQPSELARLASILFVAAYLARRQVEVQTRWWGFVKPLLVCAALSGLILLEPDLGSAAVLLAVALGVLFLAGARLLPFSLFLGAGVGLAALAAVLEPYRLQRLQAFLDPWQDPFGSGFQLAQALIAIGSGGWTGVGLGESVQKLLYLPEAHTDFLFSVLAEELGLLGVTAVIALFGVLVWRCFAVARRAEAAGLRFGVWVAYGVGMWLGLQAFINMGVNLGVLPTKGITLPLMSAGGSSLVVNLAALGLVQRVWREAREQAPLPGPSAEVES